MALVSLLSEGDFMKLSSWCSRKRPLGWAGCSGRCWVTFNKSAPPQRRAGPPKSPRAAWMSICSRNLAECSSFLVGSEDLGSYLQGQALHLRPRSQSLPSPAHPSLPGSLISSLLAPSYQLQRKHSKESPDTESGDWESDPALTLNMCMILDKINRLAEPQFPYLKTGWWTVPSLQPNFQNAPPSCTSAPFRPVSCPWIT